jgi:hypothetical protein
MKNFGLEAFTHERHFVSTLKKEKHYKEMPEILSPKRFD